MKRRQKQMAQERKTWLEHLTNQVKRGKIAEFGCGSGFVLESLSRCFTKSFIIGVDKLPERLTQVVQKKLKNVIAIQADFTLPLFPENSFDTVIFVASLHEVFSAMGIKKVHQAISNAHRVLKPGGVLIIQDFAKPEPRKVVLQLRNEKVRKKFLRFKKEFKPRKVKSKRIGGGIETDIADAVEFISKYRSRSEPDWKEEMNETHFFFTKKQFVKSVEKAGFQSTKVVPLPKRAGWWSDKRTGVDKDIGFDFRTEYGWLQITCSKMSKRRKKKGS
jgi:ubiquinone/menaquinone biosynthesis C-methylase UbiE